MHPPCLARITRSTQQLPKEAPTRTFIAACIGLAVAAGTVMAQTADELLAKYVKAVGGADKISAVKTLRRSGKGYGGGGFEAPMVILSKRPNKVRQEFTMQGLTGITAYDGTVGWKIQPWEGKRDVEALEEEELKSIVEDADFDGPLVNPQGKGITVEYVGLEPVDGTDAFKLKVKLASGDIHYYFLDTDYYVPIKIEIHRMVRGAERVYEITLGDYKEVSGWYLPFSSESNAKGSQDKWKISYDSIEANVPLDDSLFAKPVVAGQ